MPSTARARAVGKLGSTIRHHPDRIEKIAEFQAELATEKIADYVTQVVAAAPPLSPAQRDRLAVLLRSGKP